MSVSALTQGGQDQTQHILQLLPAHDAASVWPYGAGAALECGPAAELMSSVQRLASRSTPWLRGFLDGRWNSCVGSLVGGLLSLVASGPGRS